MSPASSIDTSPRLSPINGKSVTLSPSKRERTRLETREYSSDDISFSSDNLDVTISPVSSIKSTPRLSPINVKPITSRSKLRVQNKNKSTESALRKLKYKTAKNFQILHKRSYSCKYRKQISRINKKCTRSDSTEENHETNTETENEQQNESSVAVKTQLQKDVWLFI